MRDFGEVKPSLDEIAHYGVKGMRWGIRRDRPGDSTMTREQRRAAKKRHGQFFDRVFDKRYQDGGIFDLNVISEQQYRKLSTKDHVVRKGQTVGRVTTRKNEQLRDMTYVSYKPEDRNVYRAIMPVGNFRGRPGAKRYADSYEATYKALETLRSPSEKARVDAFIELFDKPSVTLKNGKTITGREYMSRAGYPREVKTLNSQQLGLRYYKDFLENQYKETPLNTAYFKNVAEKGYNSIVDDNDRDIVSKAPLIVLNPNGTLKKMNVRTLSADDINNAQLQLKVDEK